ncbi:AtpZ/AtpI family protein [Paenibacillus sp. D2_2]|uniref:AtpZ/AtpI family protein n=1 Tax=Paenibacillus sp. D2_2 TaxID=3073092 RepID=UPI00281633FE|nr:AtpZ/AtpI family protein [Paenibacillus sp. D2_2]WMT40711.1 AtpZ/AtpI family protein [Paenibacillus sp. D2_2]
MKDPTKSDDNNSGWKAVGLVTALGIELAVCTFGGFYLGSWLDKIWLGNGLGIGLGVLLGIIIGILGIIALIKTVMGGNDG